MKIFFHWVVKALIGGIFAFIALNLFCLFWYNVPFRIVSKNGMTDYAWESGAFHSRKQRCAN